MKFHTKLPPKWYFGGHFICNDLPSVSSEVILYQISYIISKVSLPSFHSFQTPGVPLMQVLPIKPMYITNINTVIMVFFLHRGNLTLVVPLMSIKY